MTRKRIGKSDIIGEQGIALIHKVVVDMGFLWHPTGLEAGIDGYIELRDPETGEVSNLIIQVQSKATYTDFQVETPEGFDYLCEARDLNYWLEGNTPVILVRSRPSTNEAYWVSIKDYFEDLSKRESRKIHFDKIKNRFDINCRNQLISLAKPKDSGIYLSPLPKNEALYSNLLEVESFASKLYLAETEYRFSGSIWRKFREMEVDAKSEWILKNKRILSFHNLEEYPWNEICDVGSIEPFDTDEWAYSDDIDSYREFVQLMNYCLAEKLKPNIRFDKRKEYYFFLPTEDLTPFILSYKSLLQKTHRIVFQGYPKKKNPSEIAYRRHSAFFERFLRLDNKWYIEITPTYHFTWNGFRRDHYGEDRLKRMKEIERNPAVLGQVIMWADYLKDKPNLFAKPYPFLTFGSLLSFDIEAGLDDKTWLAKAEKEEVEVSEMDLNQLPLFGAELDDR